MMSRLRSARGSALVETPIALGVFLLVGFGLLTVVQLAWTHLELSSSVRSAARYAARVEYDPSADPVTGERHRTPDQVVDGWRQAIADEVGVPAEDITILVGPDPSELLPGDEVVVRVSANVTNPLYRLTASLTNSLAGLVGSSGPLPVDGVRVTAEAASYVE
jgi:hypothetical protein